MYDFSCCHLTTIRMLYLSVELWWEGQEGEREREREKGGGREEREEREGGRETN